MGGGGGLLQNPISVFIGKINLNTYIFIGIIETHGTELKSKEHVHLYKNTFTSRWLTFVWLCRSPIPMPVSILKSLP